MTTNKNYLVEFQFQTSFVESNLCCNISVSKKWVPCIEGCQPPMGLVSRLSFMWVVKAFCISLWVNHQIRFALVRLFNYTSKQEVLMKAKGKYIKISHSFYLLRIFTILIHLFDF